MGPGIPGGSRQAAPAELAELSAEAPTRREHFETVLTQVRSDHDEQLRSAARELRSRGRARVILASVTLDAELLTFWRGDRLLRIERAARDRGSAGSSLARFPRHDRSDSEEVLAHYLAVSVANDRMNA